MGTGRATSVHSEGFPDAVVWNPGASKSAALDDLGAAGYQRFVCSEAAVIGLPVELAAGERWQGTQTLHAHGG
jgi:glucose-6-phosphate 1-epimerase